MFRRISLLLLLATPVGASCLPDADYTPTPVISWNHPLLVDCPGNACTYNAFDDYDDLEGFRIYARETGQPFALTWELPCHMREDDSGGFVKECRVQHAVQRGVSVDLEPLEVVVTAYRFGWESPSSPPVLICMPHVWQPGEAYE